MAGFLPPQATLYIVAYPQPFNPLVAVGLAMTLARLVAVRFALTFRVSFFGWDYSCPWRGLSQ